MTKVLRYSAALLFVTALSLLVGGSAAAQSTNNPRYRQFRDTAAASITTPAAGNVRLFFDSTGFYWKNSAGVATAVGGGGFTLTQYAIPMAATTTTLGDSKVIASAGGSSTGYGVWTLYDDTATNGVSQLKIRAGVGQSTNPLAVMYANDGTTAHYTFGPTGILTATIDSAVNDFAIKAGRSGNTGAVQIGDKGFGTGGEIALVTGGSTTVAAYASSGLEVSSAHTILWSANTTITGSCDLGLARSAAGILAVTDGSTGQGGIGIANSVTNTVSDALILKHLGGTTVDEFGTGLLYQGEDDAGNMQSMGSIDMIFTDNANASEDTRFEFRGYVAGTEYKFASLGDADNSFTIYDTAGTARFKYTNASYTLSVGGTGAIRIIGDGSNALVFPATGENGGNIYADGYKKVPIHNPVIQRGQTVTLVDNSATTFVTIPHTTDNTAKSGIIDYAITFISGGNVETEVGELAFAITNEADTVIGEVAEIGTPVQAPAGTITTTWTTSVSTTNFSILVQADSTALAVAPTITFRVRFNSGDGSFTNP